MKYVSQILQTVISWNSTIILDSKICCKAMSARCLACAKGQPIATFCEENANVMGCKGIYYSF